MYLVWLAWKNLWRNRSRTLITVSAVFFSVILSVLASSSKSGIFEQLVKNVAGIYSGYIQLHRKGYWNEQMIDNGFQISNNLENKIKASKNVIAISPRLESFALVSVGESTKGCMVIGIDPQAESKIIRLDKRLIKGNYLNKKSDHFALVSDGLIKHLNLKLQDTIILISQGYHGTIAAGRFIVSGILKFGSPVINDRTIFLKLNDAQEFYGADGIITSYVLSPKSTQNLNESTSEISQLTGQKYETMSWEDMMPEIKQHIATDSNNMFIVQCILYLLISFGIFSTLLMMMEERKAEMCMLIALGLQNTNLSLTLFFESIITVSLGCISGILASIPIAVYFNHHPIKLGAELSKSYERFGFEAIFPTSIDPSIFIEQAIIVLCIGVLLSIYPAIKSLQLDPVKSIHQ